MCNVPQRERRRRHKDCICSSVGHCIYCANLFTLIATSGLVRLKYWGLPIKARYSVGSRSSLPFIVNECWGIRWFHTKKLLMTHRALSNNMSLLPTLLTFSQVRTILLIRSTNWRWKNAWGIVVNIFTTLVSSCNSKGSSWLGMMDQNDVVGWLALYL